MIDLIASSAHEAADVLWSMMSVTPPLIMYSKPPLLCSFSKIDEFDPLLHRKVSSKRGSKVIAYISPVIYTSYEGDVAEQGSVIIVP